MYNLDSQVKKIRWLFFLSAPFRECILHVHPLYFLVFLSSQFGCTLGPCEFPYIFFLAVTKASTLALHIRTNHCGQRLGVIKIIASLGVSWSFGVLKSSIPSILVCHPLLHQYFCWIFTWIPQNTRNTQYNKKQSKMPKPSYMSRMVEKEEVVCMQQCKPIEMEYLMSLILIFLQCCSIVSSLIFTSMLFPLPFTLIPVHFKSCTLVTSFL